MKKNSLLLIALNLLAISAFSQSLSKSIIAPQGGVNSTADLTLEWTLGENFIETVSEANNIYTQGFNQSYTNSENQIPIDFIDDLFGIKVTPNPVQTLLNLKITGDFGNILNAHMFDTQGRLVKSFDTNSVNMQRVLDVSSLPSGVYYLSIRNADGKSIKSTKIIKY